MADVMKVLNDLKYKAVGVDPNTKKMPEGYFVSFRPIGLPIPEEDFKNPWTPTGSSLKQILDSKPKAESGTAAAGQDPATLQAVSASKQLDDLQFLTAGIGSSMQAFLQTFMLTDSKIVLDASYRVAPGTSKVNDTWFAIINGANGIAPDLELNDEMKKSIEKANATLMDKEGNPSAHYEKYMQYRDEYQEAVRTRDKQYANAMSDPMKLMMWPIQGKTYQDDIDHAWDKWQSFGFKQEIDEAIAVLSSQGIDPAILLIARAKHKYENSLVNIPTIGNIPYTFMTPSKWYSANGADGWNHYSQADYHSETHFESSSSRTSAGGGFSLGFFSIGGGGSTSEDRTSLNIQTEGLTVEFEYAVADIQRPWLDTTLLNLSNWFLVGDYPASCISDGTFNQQFKMNNPTEMLFLPSVVTSFIVARNVSIKWKKTASDMDLLRTASSGGGSIGFGPFSVCAHHQQSRTKNDFTYDENSQGITISGVQLIGYVSTIMPGSPKKNGKDYMQKKTDKQPKKEEPVQEPAKPAPAPVTEPTPVADTNPAPAPVGGPAPAPVSEPTPDRVAEPTT